jgi:hypothetical protein
MLPFSHVSSDITGHFQLRKVFSTRTLYSIVVEIEYLSMTMTMTIIAIRNGTSDDEAPPKAQEKKTIYFLCNDQRQWASQPYSTAALMFFHRLNRGS